MNIANKNYDVDNYEQQFNDLVKQCTEQLSNIKVNIRSKCQPPTS